MRERVWGVGFLLRLFCCRHFAGEGARATRACATRACDKCALVCLSGRRQLEGDAAVVVLFLGGQEIEIRESDLPGVSRSQSVECLFDEGVFADLQLMTFLDN